MESRSELEGVLAGALAREVRLVWAYLFGSAARAEGYRDVDVAIMPEAGAFATLNELGRLQIRLSEEAGGEVDLVDLRRAPPALLGSILRERCVLLDLDRVRRHAWEAEAASRVLDYELVLERYSALRHERLRQRLSGAG